MTITLNNESEIEAKLFLDLWELPEFEIAMDEQNFEDEDIKSEIMQPVYEDTWQNGEI